MPVAKRTKDILSRVRRTDHQTLPSHQKKKRLKPKERQLGRPGNVPFSVNDRDRNQMMLLIGWLKMGEE